MPLRNLNYTVNLGEQKSWVGVSGLGSLTDPNRKALFPGVVVSAPPSEARMPVGEGALLNNFQRLILVLRVLEVTLKGNLTQDSAKCLHPNFRHCTFPSAQNTEGGAGG